MSNAAELKLELGPLRTEAAEKMQQNLLTGAAALAGLLAVGYVLDSEPGKRQFYYSYLTGWTWALTICLGALFWNLIHYVSSAGWSVGHRRILENITRALPWLALLGLPLLGGLDSIYKWTHADDLKHGKQIWLSKSFFVGRICFYFLVWILYARFLRNGSIKLDANPPFEEKKATLRTLGWYAPSGVLLLGLTATFAAFDLIMSLNFTWYSTIFGVIYWADGLRGSLATVVLIVFIMHRAGYLRGIITSEHFHDLGKLMFGLTIFWAYVSFSQYFLYWYGNMPEETKFFLDRRYTEVQADGESILQPTSWYSASVLLGICYFGVPFLALLRRDCKRNPKWIAGVACWILAFQWFHQYWEIMPEGLKETVHSYPRSGVQFHWLDAVSVAFFVSVIANCVLHGFRTTAMIPIGDPRLGESLRHEVDEFGD